MSSPHVPGPTFEVLFTGLLSGFLMFTGSNGFLNAMSSGMSFCSLLDLFRVNDVGLFVSLELSVFAASL